jgi:penicillin-binding protein 1A
LPPLNYKAPYRKKRSPAQIVGLFLRRAFVVGVVLSLLAIGYVGASIWLRLRDLPDVTLVEKYEPIEAIQIFDKNDHLICTVEGDEDRRVVPLNQISNQMQQAMLAAEDHHFFEHHGVNFMSIFRAFLANVQARHVVEGGSTITQQLVKNLFFTESGRTIDRKVKEALIAGELEQRYSKERILEMYLNQVYFGNNAYGIERAASRYFDRSAASLNLSQSAFLAGLVKAPSELGALNNRQEALNRQHEILDKMVEYGYITGEQEKKALATKLVFRHGVNPLQKYPYYVTYVLEQLRDKFTQADMRRQGLRVYTNLDPGAQEIAEKVLNEDIKKAPKGLSQLALVSVTVGSGAVIAMVGGVGNFWQNQFNRATNPHTAGSSFKPFVYLTAFRKGIANPETPIDDKPLVVHQPYGLPDYVPKDFDHKFMGRITMRKALALSRNVPSVRTAQLAGVDNIIETARLAGITTKLDANLSLALGSSAVSPLDMAGAYSTFARVGVAIKPQTIRRIENNKGEVIDVEEQKVDKVFNVEPVAELLDVMQDVVKYGTGTGAKLEDRPVAGKTGTADAGKDIWFIGFTPDLVTACWGGNDENLAIPGTNVTGGVVMAKIWHNYMEAYYKAFPTPPGSFIAPDMQKNPAPAGDKLAKKDNATAGTASDASKTNSEPSAVTLSPSSTGGLSAETPKEDATTAETSSVAHAKSAGQQTSDNQAANATEPAVAPAPAPSIVSTARGIMPSLAPERSMQAERSTQKADEGVPPVAPRRLYPAVQAPAFQPAPRLYPATPTVVPTPQSVLPSSAPAAVPELRPPISPSAAQDNL